jgi:dTMP kinase
MKKPPFIVIEGIDRCGKNLQADLLIHRLESVGISTSFFSTPCYNGVSGEAIASYLHGLARLSNVATGEKSIHDALALECMMIANRYEVAAQVVKSLDAGLAVVCVRWKPSAELYGLEDGLRQSFIAAACSLLPDPDLCVLLDVNPADIAERFDKTSRYELGTRQIRLAEAYRMYWLTQQLPPKATKWPIVSGANAKPEKVENSVWELVKNLPHFRELNL